jgi:hypothetical protein
VENGVVRNCRIFNMRGFNSDGVDIGEGASNIILDSMLIYNITDKGVSVGQRSSVTLSNSLIMNCDLGVGIKDSSRLQINKCTFYGNNMSVAAFEKNLGDAGGNIKITNSILSNSSTSTVFSDSKSSVSAKYCLSDNTNLPGVINYYGNPQFTNPVKFDFRPKSNSPIINTGNDNGEIIDLGIYFSGLSLAPQLVIAGIYINPADNYLPEFIMLINPSDAAKDISGYSFSKGITQVMPLGTSIAAHDTIYVTNRASATFWNGTQKQVVEWSDGKLSDNGEALELRESHGIIIDHLKYDTDTWPALDDFSFWHLKSLNVDNHFAENWTIQKMEIDPLSLSDIKVQNIEIFPNPTFEKIVIRSQHALPQEVTVLSISGQVISRYNTNCGQTFEIDFSKYSKGTYLININNETKKVIKLGN